MAFRTQKISQMTPKGADLEATDLIEVSTIESGSYVTRSITGQELIDAIPLPPSGLTIGTTPIASGTIGRVLFQGTGNVLQQSSSLFWDNTGFLGIGTSTPNAPSTYSGITINSATAGSYIWFQNAGTIKYSIGSESNVNYHNLTAGTSFLIRSGGSSYFNVVQSTGNVQIGTTTDAGFKLDVNGTARVQGNLTTNSATSGILIRDWTAFNTYRAFYKSSETPSDTNYLMAFDTDVILNSRGSGTDIRFNGAIRARFGNAFSLRVIGTGTTTATVGFEATNSSSTPLLQVRDNGAVLINTTTDAGFRLDVNGTARVNTLTIGLGTGQVATNTVVGLTALNANTTGNQTTAIGNQSLNRNTTGNANVAVGSQSMLFNLTGELNTVVGTNALLNNSTGSSNTAMGLGVSSGNFSGSVILGREATATANNQFVVGSTGTNAGTVTTEVNVSTQVWNVVINGVARKILLA